MNCIERQKAWQEFKMADQGGSDPIMIIVLAGIGQDSNLREGTVHNMTRGYAVEGAAACKWVMLWVRGWVNE